MVHRKGTRKHTCQRHHVHAVLFISGPVKEKEKKKQHSWEELIYNGHCVCVQIVRVCV